MNHVSIRFPHLMEKIFNLLNNENISKCREVSRFWMNAIDHQKFLHIRKIKALKEIVGNFHTINEAWNNLFETASKADVKDLAIAICQFYNDDTNLNYYEGLTPLHIVAGRGNLKLFEIITNNSDKKHEKDSMGHTPFTYAAQNGHLKVCEFIIGKSNF